MDFRKMSINDLEQYLLENPFDFKAYSCLSNRYTTTSKQAGLWEYFTKFYPRNYYGFSNLVRLYKTNVEKEHACLLFMKNTPYAFEQHFELAKSCNLHSETFLSEYMYNAMLKNRIILDCDEYKHLKNELLSDSIILGQDIEISKKDVQQNPHSFIDSHTLATAYCSSGNTDAEIGVWLQFIEKNKNNILGYFEFESIGDQLSTVDMVLHYYDKSRDNNLHSIIGSLLETDYPSHIASLPDTLKGCIYRQAWCCIDCDYKSAAQKWEKYLNNNPDNYYALINCGECFALSGEGKKASKMYTRAFAAAPDEFAKNKVIEKQTDLLEKLPENKREQLNQEIARESSQLNPQQVQQEVQNEPERELVDRKTVASDAGQKNVVSAQQVHANNAENHQQNAQQMQRK